MDGRARVNLSGKPQPTLSNVHEGELVHRVGHGAGRIDVPVCTHSELIAGHLTPGFIVTLKASAQGFTLADLVRGRGLFAPAGIAGARLRSTSTHGHPRIRCTQTAMPTAITKNSGSATAKSTAFASISAPAFPS